MQTGIKQFVRALQTSTDVDAVSTFEKFKTIFGELTSKFQQLVDKFTIIPLAKKASQLSFSRYFDAILEGCANVGHLRLGGPFHPGLYRLHICAMPEQFKRKWLGPSPDT